MAYKGEQDPLCYEGTPVLRNLGDFRDQDRLDEFESAMFLLRSSQPWPAGELGVDYYRRLHRHLFQDVYAWAGEFRSVRIGKGGNWFCYPEYISGEMERLFAWAAQRQWFSEHAAPDFVADAARFLADLNAIHPFREGNGRTQLAFLSVLCDVNGLPFNDAALHPETVLQAMIASFVGRLDELSALIDEITRP